MQDAVFTTFYLRLNAEVLIKAMSMGGTITYLSPGEIDESGELHSQAAAPGARVGRLVFASRRGQFPMK